MPGSGPSAPAPSEQRSQQRRRSGIGRLVDPALAVQRRADRRGPVAMAPLLPVPMVTTLHTPPTPWLESAFALDRDERGHVVSVSETNAAQWDSGTVHEVIANGVDCDLWRPDPDGRPRGAVWFGRLVPEKAPHLASGAVPELLTEDVGRLAAPGDVEALARAITDARSLDRTACRHHAVDRFSLARMVDQYEDVLLRCAAA